MSPADVDMVKVSEADLHRFEMALVIACSRRLNTPFKIDFDIVDFPVNEKVVSKMIEPKYFKRRKDDALVVSFDKYWSPFLCNRISVNLPKERWYIPENNFTNLIARKLQTPEQMRFTPDWDGARIFVLGDSVRRHPEGCKEFKILQLDLPYESQFLFKRQTLW